MNQPTSAQIVTVIRKVLGNSRFACKVSRLPRCNGAACMTLIRRESLPLTPQESCSFRIRSVWHGFWAFKSIPGMSAATWACWRRSSLGALTAALLRHFKNENSVCFLDQSSQKWHCILYKADVLKKKFLMPRTLTYGNHFSSLIYNGYCIF